MVTGGDLDPLAREFTWRAYEASGHRKPLLTTNRPPLNLTMHSVLGAMPNLSDPWQPESEFKTDKAKAHEKFVDGFRLHMDDAWLWKNTSRGLYAHKDPFPEVSVSLSCTC